MGSAEVSKAGRSGGTIEMAPWRWHRWGGTMEVAPEVAPLRGQKSGHHNVERDCLNGEKCPHGKLYLTVHGTV